MGGQSRSVLGLGAAAIVGLGFSTPASAQRVSADIHIASFPVAATIHIGDRHPRRFRHDVYFVKRRGRGWGRRHDRDRYIVVYYDPYCDLYFDRPSRGLERVRIYFDGNRYYRMDEPPRRYRDRDGWRDRYRYYDDDDRYDRDRDRPSRPRDVYDRDKDRDSDWYDDDDREWKHEHDRDHDRDQDRDHDRDHDHDGGGRRSR